MPGPVAEAKDPDPNKIIFLYGRDFDHHRDDYHYCSININHASDSCNKSINYRGSLRLRITAGQIWEGKDG